MKNSIDYDKEIDSLRWKIKELEEQKNRYNQLTEAERLAIILHDSFCRHRHDESGCSWLYDTDSASIPTWTSTVQKKYLNMATMLLTRYKCGTIVDIAEIIKNNRY